MSQNGVVAIVRTPKGQGFEYRVKHVDSDALYWAFDIPAKEMKSIIATATARKAARDKARDGLLCLFADAVVFANEEEADTLIDKILDEADERQVPVEYGATSIEWDEEWPSQKEDSSDNE